jgi:hypothetical protein
MPKRIGMTLSICNYKKVHICIVVAQDFQVSNSGSWEPLVLEPSWNPPLTNFWIREDWKIFFNRNIYCIFRIKLFIFIFMVFSILDWSKSERLKYFFSPSSRSRYLFGCIVYQCKGGDLSMRGKLQYKLRFPP